MTDEQINKAALSATQGAKQDWQNLASTGVTAAAKWKAERDELQARIGKTNSIIATYRSMDSPADVAPTIDWPGVLDDLHAALQGDVPTEPASDLERADDAPSPVAPPQASTQASPLNGCVQASGEACGREGGGGAP